MTQKASFAHPFRVADLAGRKPTRFTLTPGPAAGQGTASGSFTLKRLDFRLGEGEWADVSAVANEVQVRFRLQLSGLAAP